MASEEKAAREARIIDGFNARDTYKQEKDSFLFRALAEGDETIPFKKELGAALDDVVSKFPEKESIAIRESVLKRALVDVSNNSQLLTDKVGREAADLIAQNLKTQIASSASSGSQALSQAGKIVSDVGYSVFKSPAQEEIATLLALESGFGGELRPNGTSLFPRVAVEQAQKTAVSQTQTVFVNGIFVSGKIQTAPFEAAIVHSRLPIQFPLFFDAKQLAFFAFKKAGDETAGKILAGEAIKRGAGAALIQFLAKLGINVAVGTSGGIIGVAAGIVISFGKQIASVVSKGFSATLSGKAIPVIGNAIGAFSSYFTGGRPEAKDDTILPIAILVIAAVVIPLSTTLFQILPYRGSAFIAEGVGGGGHGTNEGKSGPCGIAYTGGGSPPPSSLPNACPVDRGSITQSPNGEYSHQGVQAYDFGGNNGTPVKATHGGYIHFLSDATTDETVGDVGGCANQVQIVAENGGSVFSTVYGHLSQGMPAEIIAKYQAYLSCQRDPSNISCKPQSTGVCNCPAAFIAAGTVIGYVDHTGNSTGPHLHYELKGGTITIPASCGK
jgi:murein DD-endopeptidase MepM/ murein hydrolase activator NlpD